MTTKNDNVNQLANTILKLKRAYYEGHPETSDCQYDATEEALRQLDPLHPVLKLIGAPLTGKKFDHRIAMGSQSKVNDFSELTKWFKSLGMDVHEKMKSGFLMTLKADGLSVELIYEKGRLVQALTRGDGIEGEDVTQSVIFSGRVPLSVSLDTRSVRAECVIFKQDWEHVKKEHAPRAKPFTALRNAAAGILRRSKPNGADHLHFLAFDETSETGQHSEETVLNDLEHDGFEVIDSWYFKTLEDAWSWFSEYKLQDLRSKSVYEIDGFVIKLNDRSISDMLGSKDGCPCGQRAIKFDAPDAVTTLEDVVWKPGHTGVITPRGFVAPVVVGGVTVTHATLCNPDELARLDLAIGDTVTLSRRGDVIPKIENVLVRPKNRKAISIPDRCPSCRKPVAQHTDDANIYCTNEDCRGRAFSRVMNWISRRNILGLGEATLLSAFETRLVQEIAGLYKVSAFDWGALNTEGRVVGGKTGLKLYEAIEASRDVTVTEFIASVGCPLFGDTLAQRIAEEFPQATSSLSNWYGFLNDGMLAKVSGFGEGRITAVMAYFDPDTIRGKEIMQAAKQMRFIEPKKEKSVSNKLAGMSFCFTGALPSGMKRDDAWAIVYANGGVVHKSMKEGTTYLVAGERVGAVKEAAAEKYGTTVITEGQFTALFAAR